MTIVPIAQITTGVTLDDYQREQKMLAEIGEAFPGRLLQVCYGDPDNLTILTVYESVETRDRFATTILTPILDRLGIAEKLADRGFSNEIEVAHKIMADPAQCPGPASPGDARTGILAEAELPAGVARFISSINAHDLDGLMALFPPDEAVRMIDAGKVFRDRAEIRSFSERELIDSNGHMSVDRVESSDEGLVVTGEFRSDRYSGPARFVFILENEKLVQVSLEPA